MAILLAACGSSATLAPISSVGATPATGATSAASPAATPAASPAATAVSGSSPAATGSAAADTAPTCTSPASPTVAQTEGPYYKAGAPQKASLYESGMSGTRLTLIGYVVNTSCQPLANAKVDVWQADASGQYDNSGYRLRGYVLTDASGRFSIETVIPGEYPGRTEHIHVKVTPSGGSTLTTQLYFPDQASANQADSIYNASMLLKMTPNGSAYVGTYTFIMQA